MVLKRNSIFYFSGISGFLRFLSTILILLFFFPNIIELIGKEEFGKILFLLTSIQLSNILTVGLSKSLTLDSSAELEFPHINKKFFDYIIYLIFVILLLIILIISFNFLFNFGINYFDLSTYIFFLVLFSSSISNLFYAYLESKYKIHIVNTFIILQNISFFFFIYILISYDLKYYINFSILFISFFFSLATILISIFKYQLKIKFGHFKLNKKIIYQIFNFYLIFLPTNFNNIFIKFFFILIGGGFANYTILDILIRIYLVVKSLINNFSIPIFVYTIKNRLTIENVIKKVNYLSIFSLFVSIVGIIIYFNSSPLFEYFFNYDHKVIYSISLYAILCGCVAGIVESHHRSIIGLKLFHYIHIYNLILIIGTLFFLVLLRFESNILNFALAKFASQALASFYIVYIFYTNIVYKKKYV